jgi:hypothetical protein
MARFGAGLAGANPLGEADPLAFAYPPVGSGHANLQLPEWHALV